MKAMKYILIVIGLVSILTIKAETWSEQPKASMHSTSTMPLSGSNLPQAAVNGTYTTYDQPKSPSGPRRIIDQEDQEDKETNGWEEPGQPLTDAVPCLLLLAAAYGIYLRRKNSIQTRDSQRQQ
jgi:hypothetical protein